MTESNIEIVTQNNASQICNNIPFHPLCSFNLFLLSVDRVIYSHFQYGKNLIYDERLVAFISSSTTTITNNNKGNPQEMMTPAHKNVVLILIVVVKS